MEVEFKFQRGSCKLSFLFPPRRKSAAESLLAGFPFLESADNFSGALLSKVPIINGPGKLSPFTLKIEVSIVLHLTC